MTDAGIEPNEAKCELKMLLEHFCGYTDKDKIMGKELTESQYNLINTKVGERIATRTPVQYIIGKAWFMGNYYKVTPSVLIPRDETELLVKKAIEIIQKNNLRKVLDIGTGSGCIACAIAKCTDAEVLGTDVSSDALRVALDNVTLLGINNRAVFRKSDLFEKIHPDEKFDMIISNPPYIRSTLLRPETYLKTGPSRPETSSPMSLPASMPSVWPPCLLPPKTSGPRKPRTLKKFSSSATLGV